MKLVIGPATQAAKEPLIANTMMMAITCQFELIPHRSFNFSIRCLIFGKCKYNLEMNKFCLRLNLAHITRISGFYE